MADKIIDFGTMFGRDITVEAFARAFAGRFGVQLPPTSQMSGVPVYAEVNAMDLGPVGQHGRWIAKCTDCSGAEYVDPENPIFMCLSCMNRSIAGQWRRVVFPRQKAAIEQALLARPAAHRNWVPGETVADLHAENKRMGIPSQAARE